MQAARKEVPVSHGERVEVKWTLHDEAEEGETNQAREEDEEGREEWWAATLREATEAERGGGSAGVGEQVWVLQYDAMNGFESEESRCTFLDQTWLYDLDYEGWLMWRKEGEEQVFSLGDVVDPDEEQEIADEAEGFLNQLPSDQRANLADGFQNFMSSVSRGLTTLMQSRESGHVVTQQEMLDIVDRARSSK